MQSNFLDLVMKNDDSCDTLSVSLLYSSYSRLPGYDFYETYNLSVLIAVLHLAPTGYANYLGYRFKQSYIHG